MTHADVVIVGGGLAGLASAWWLAPHQRVAVLEQGEALGAEATAQNAGMVRRLGEDPCERALAMRTHRFLQSPPDEMGVLATRTGAVLGLAHDPHHLHDAVAHLRAAGVPIAALDRPAAVAPVLAGARFSACWYDENALVADVHAVVSGLRRSLTRQGSEVRCGVQVSGLRIESGRVVGVDTPTGPVLADRVVLAAGAWSGALAARAGLWRPLIPLRRTLLFGEEATISRPDHPWCWVDDVGIYARPEAGGWLVSGCDEAVAPSPPGPGSSGAVEDAHRALASDKLDRHIPALAGLRLSRGWTGLRTFAPDRAPVLGQDPEVSGLWWVAGLGGFGVTCGIAAAEAVTTWMGGGETPWLDAAGVSPARPWLRRWPIRPTGDMARARLVSTAATAPRP
jgi:D-arginine dehydrogenase